MMHYDLEARKISKDAAQKVYEMTNAFPREELFGISAQMRRAAVSIPSNITEGSARQSAKEGIRFLRIAQGPLAELKTQLELARRINFLEEEKFLEIKPILARAARLLNGLVVRAQNSL